MYNSSSWAAPKHVIEKLNICQRKHLRHILNYKWPHVISNDTLYKRCDTTPLSERMEQARWQMLGHILRGPENAPAAVALTFALDGSCEFKSRRGRHQINLFNVIRNDLVNRDFKLNDLNDLFELRMFAKNRYKWRNSYYSKTPIYRACWGKEKMHGKSGCTVNRGIESSGIKSYL